DDTGLPPLAERWYWVSTVDLAGNESAKAGPASGTVRQITAADIGDAIIDYDNFAADVVALFTGIAADIGELTDDTVALEADVSTLQTQYTSLNGSVSTNSTAISGLETRVTSAEGAITTSASQITALQSDLSDVESDVSGQATAISGLDTRVTDAEGDISAVSSSVTSLSTTVGDNTASITQAAQSIDGIEAKYTVEVDGNGISGGFQLIGGGGSTAFNIRADQFALFPPSGGSGGTQVFTVFTTNRTIGGVFYPAGVYMEQAYIDAARIIALDADSISVSNLAEFTGFFNASSGSRSVLIDPGGSLEVFEAIGSGSQNVARIVKTSGTSTGTALEVRQEGSSASGIFIDKVGGGSGDALLIETNGGSGSAGADIRN
ncbi:MAG: hypothetical protein MI867_27575, partial [Pseudomonadales bacterium]|nr:hypothetical protein [Pseudomonadales bacterium]